MRNRSLTAAALALAIIALPVAADTKIVRKTHVEGGMMGAAAPEDRLSTFWMGEGRFAQTDGSSGVAIDLNAGKLYMIHHADKTYNVLDLPIDFSKLMPPEFAAMIGQMKIEVTVTPTDDTKTIGEYATRKYLLQISAPMTEVEQTVWVTKDTVLDLDDYRTMMLEMNSVQPLGQDVAKKMAEIDGFPVLSESKVAMMGQEIITTETLVSIEQGADAPPGTYTPLSTYVEKPFDPMQGMGGPRRQPG